MSIKSLMNKVSNIRVLFFSFIFLIIITKIDCWPVFKQDPLMTYIQGSHLLQGKKKTIETSLNILQFSFTI